MTAKLGHAVPIATFVLLLAACGSPDESAAGNDESSSSGGGTGPDSATATAGMSSTSATTTATSTTTTAGTTVTSADSGEESMGFINPDSGGESGPVGPGPNGSQCGGNDECDSGFCYQVPMLGGVCSECLMDADCGEGTCALDFNTMYAICTDGSLGNMCDSDEGCMGELVCTELLDTGGIFNASFCSDCGETAPCEGEQVCNPVYDTMGIGGYMTCVDPMSVENGQGCPVVAGMGDGSVCLSGHCGTANLFMFLELGVCGECSVDADCVEAGTGDTCTPASAGMGGLMGATCT